jgi:hypothetical protein
MNWRFVRRNHWVQFQAGEPICFFFPIQRGYLETVTPRFVPMDADPEVMRQFKEWSRSRDELHARVRATPVSGSDTWQKNYYRGLDPDNRPAVADHSTKLRLKPFTDFDTSFEP